MPVQTFCSRVCDLQADGPGPTGLPSSPPGLERLRVLPAASLFAGSITRFALFACQCPSSPTGLQDYLDYAILQQ